MENRAMASCCGTEMAKGCPCGTVLREHRIVTISVFVGIALTLLIGLSGSILGFIAFFRTF